jgi:hypothetical protein
MKPEELTDDAIDYILANLAAEDRLTKWESGFVASVSEQWDRDRFLTEKQKETLGKVWDKY